MPNHQQNICTWLENKLHSDIKIDNFSLEWNGGYPLLQLDKLQLTGKNSDNPAITSDKIKLEINLAKLLTSFKVIYNTISINNMVVNLENSDANSWNLRGVTSLSRSWDSKNNLYFTYLFAQILTSKIEINDVFVNLHTKSNICNLKIPQILVDPNKHNKVLQAKLYLDNRAIEISGQSTNTKKGEYWQGKLKVADIIIADLKDFIDKDFSIIKNCSASIDSNWYADNDSVKADGFFYLKNINNTDSMNIVSKFFYQASAIDVFNLWLQDIYCNYNNAPKSELKANIFISNKFVDKKYFICSASNLHLQKTLEITQNFLHLDNSYYQTIQQSDPKGKLDNFYLKFNLDTIKNQNKLELTALLNNVSIKATAGIPELTNISGKLSATETNGVFYMDSKKFDIHIKNIFNEKMQYEFASAIVKWNINNNSINLSLQNINLISDKEQVKGLLNLYIPKKNAIKPAHLSLLLSAKNTTLDILPKYLPKETIVSPTVNAWLNNSLHHAQIDQITYLFHGNLQKQNNNITNNQTRVFCLFNNLTVDIPEKTYSIDNARGKLALSGTQVDIITTSANLLKNDIQHLEASITLNDNNKLSIHAILQSKDKQINELLTHVIDNEKLVSALQDIKLDGLINSKVDIYLPLQQQENYNPIVDVNSKMINVNLYDEKNKIKVNSLNGSFNYNNLTGLNTDCITGYFFDEKHTFEIKTTLDPETEGIKTISGICNGNISFKNIKELVNYPIDTFVSGKMRHRCTWDFYPVTDESHFTLESKLEGVSSILPSPFYKESTESLPIHLRFYMNQNNHKQVNLELKDNNSININLKNSNDSLVYILDGSIAKVNAKEWLDFFTMLPETAQTSSFKLDGLQIKELNYENFKLNNIEIKSMQDNKYHHIGITSDIATGIILFSSDNKLPIIIDFKKIEFNNENTVDSNSLSLLKDKLIAMKWKKLPKIQVKIDQLNYNNLEISKTNFEVDITDNIIKIIDLKTHLQDTDIQLFADWQKDDEINKCWLQGDIISKGKNSLVNNLLKQKEIISANKASFSFALGWDDTPFNLEKNKVYGTISAVLEDGKLNKIEKSTKILKPLGLFNADSLFKRLKLDFSDLFSSGYSFEKIKGDCLLSYGKIYTDDYIIMISSSSTQRLSGMVDLNTNKLDLDLVITLPIVSNLPIISLFLAANPMLSALIFIADKAIGKKINALANISYHIYGNTDNPKTVLKKL